MCNDQTLIADSLLASNPTEAAKQGIASKGLHKIYHRKTEIQILMMETMYWSPTPQVVRRPLLSLEVVNSADFVAELLAYTALWWYIIMMNMLFSGFRL